MESRGHRLERLLGALEDLVHQERVAVHAGDHERLRFLQERTEPLIAALVELGAPAAHPAIRARLGALLRCRENWLAQLEDQIATTRAALDEICARRSQLDRIRPAYRSAAESIFTSRLQAAV